MTNVYHCVTGNWLHSSKRLFMSFDEVKRHIDYILALKPDWIDEYEILSSIRITMIDSDELPNYEKIFLTTSDIKAPKPRQALKLSKV